MDLSGSGYFLPLSFPHLSQIDSIPDLYLPSSNNRPGSFEISGMDISPRFQTPLFTPSPPSNQSSQAPSLIPFWNSDQPLSMRSNYPMARSLQPEPSFSSQGSQAVMNGTIPPSLSLVPPSSLVPTIPIPFPYVTQTAVVQHRGEYEGAEPFYQVYLSIRADALISDRSRVRAFENLMRLERRFIIENYQAGECSTISSLARPGVTSLQRLMADQVSNYQIFGWIFCSMNKGFRNTAFDFNANTLAVSHTITRLAQVTSHGSFGHIWDAEFRGLNDLTLIKTFGDTAKGPDEITHEFFVGYVLNELREEIPNFMFVYGMFRCSHPKDGYPACPTPLTAEEASESNKKNYLLMELVIPPTPYDRGYSFFHVCRNGNAAQFMMVYLQVLCSLAVAYRRFGFTHYDLHDGNVMLQHTRNDEWVFIPYTFEGLTCYIKTNMIVKIIDYGQSSVTIQKDGHPVSFGNVIQSSSKALNTNIFGGNPIYDTYKLSGFALNTLRKFNHPLLREVYKIITRFPPFDDLVSPTDPDDFQLFDKQLEAQRFNYFDYRAVRNAPIDPPNPPPDKTFSTHIQYVLDQYPQFLNTVLYNGTDGSARLLQCDELSCANWNQVQERAGI